MSQLNSRSSMPTSMPLRRLNTSSILRCSLFTCMCWYTYCACLFKLLALLSPSLFLHTHPLSLSPIHSPSTYHTPGLSHISFPTLDSSLPCPPPQTPFSPTPSHSPLPCFPQQTPFSPTPSHTPAHYPTHHSSLSLPISIYHLLPPSPLHYRISSSFPTCQVMMFTMGYRKHFGSELHVPTRKGKSSV